MDNIIPVDFANRQRVSTEPTVEAIDPYIAAVMATVSTELLSESDPSAAADAQTYAMFAKLFANQEKQNR